MVRGVRRDVLERGRGTNEKSEFGGCAIPLRLAAHGHHGYGTQDGYGMNCNGGRVAKPGNANDASARAARSTSMGVRRLQRVEHQDQQDAAQGDPAPKLTRLELRLVGDTHSWMLGI